MISHSFPFSTPFMLSTHPSCVESEYWRLVSIVVPIICGVLATAVFLLRLYCRRADGQAFTIDDLMMGMGLLFSYAVTGCTTFSAVHHGGKQPSIWSPEEEERHLLASWLFDKLWPFAQVFVKTSILIFLDRLFSVIQRFRTLARGLIVFTVAWGVAAVLVATLECSPPQYYWNKKIEGHCMPQQAAFYNVIGSLAFVEDIIILLMPIPIVWQLRSTVQQKFKATALLSIGALVCVFSILRFIEYLKYVTPEQTGLGAKGSLWANLELYFGIICGCFLVCKPLLRKIRMCLRVVSRGILPETSGDRRGLFYLSGLPPVVVQDEHCSEPRPILSETSAGGNTAATETDLDSVDIAEVRHAERFFASDAEAGSTPRGILEQNRYKEA
ncbi:hypothetical protein BDV26DRAFT_290643 [Aspergillus bertholletiae]|uniref:Rhodopsin domain-containing protein n=1 Tax=Aspergillus bertholletiae TaxID=1226010 RepID=A0A5N7BE83_9EURO|nr:hypothetical protein BDV26DRAFT_290643 [Aspergillus bertholletiae]